MTNKAYIRFSFYHFPNRTAAWWAFKQMRLAHQHLTNTPGLLFYKLLGSGAGEGFSIRPDFKVYALLQKWESQEACDKAQHRNWFKELSSYKDGEYHFQLEPYLSKGSWSGLQPFDSQDIQAGPLMAVLTRARIKFHMLVPFWLAVPEVSKVISSQKSLLFQKGVGEWPLIEQATFSIWDQEMAMKDFAYRQKAHAEVVKKTRQLNWYSEEQFTRFKIVSAKGNWPSSRFAALEQLLTKSIDRQNAHSEKD